jgi:tellurite resistance protein
MNSSESIQQESSIEHLPVSIFASVMGLGGLSIATAKLETVYGLAPLASITLLAIAAIAWVVIALSYATKVIRYPEALLAELNHPVRLSFFPTISIGLLLISIGLVEILPLAAQMLWWIGAIGQLGFTLLILNRWFHHEHFRTEHNSPAWFIPIVGNILVPVAGVEFGYTEISYFFFSIGIVFWLPLLGITLNRSFFFSGIPERLKPTLFILIAPPAVAFISWKKLHGGNLDDFGVITYFFALFITLMLVTQAKQFLNLRFALPFWAYTFPLAAVTIASFSFYESASHLHYLIIATALFVVTFLVVFYVAVLTVVAAVRGKICLPE